MSSFVPVAVHASQYPETVRRELLESLQRRQINHKFHYESLKQSQRWLALHQAFSPSRTQSDCAAVYDSSFAAVAERHTAEEVHLIGLGCGGGQKDSRLLRLFKTTGNRVGYLPVDVSLTLVLTARDVARTAVGELNCSPLVCDLGTAEDLPELFRTLLSPLAGRLATVKRVFTFFGMLPNFEPNIILPRLRALLRPGDVLLLSANLAPGPDYEAGVRKILPQYDNELTRIWLLTFLLDLGMEKRDGEIRFVIEELPAGGHRVKRIAAYFHFLRDCQVVIDGDRFQFRKGDTIRLFFSYRHTPELARAVLRQYGMAVGETWIAQNAEEGVFLVVAN